MISVLPGLAARVRSGLGDSAGGAWLTELPGLVRSLHDRWGLGPDEGAGGPWSGHESLVLPVTSPAGAAVLRLAFDRSDPRVHARETAALRLWDGRGAVRLLADDGRHRASLLERLDAGRDLGTVPLGGTAPVWGRLVRELTAAAPPSAGAGFGTVQERAAGWLRDFPGLSERLLPGFGPWAEEDGGLLDLALAAAAELAGSGDARLLHADLHHYNVLAEAGPAAASGSAWRAIDPQPLTGPPEFALAPMLWNRLYDHPGGDPEDQAASLRDYAGALGAAAGLDHGLALATSVAREIENLFWYLADGDVPAAERSLWVARAAAGHGVRGVDAGSLARLG